MILIDSRIGSKELIPLFAPYDVPVRESTLEFGDFSHLGNGPEGLIWIGYERKVLTDMIESMRLNRLGGYQFPGCFETYQVTHLVVEGIWRIGRTGIVEIPRSGEWKPQYIGNQTILGSELDHFIATHVYKRGIVIERTANRDQTVELIVSRYKWWNDKTWDQHRSDDVIYTVYKPVEGSGSGRRASFTRRTVPLLEKLLAQFDGVDAVAYSVAKCLLDLFGDQWWDGLRMLTADDLASIPVEQNSKKGRRMVKLGPAKAKRIWEQLREI